MFESVWNELVKSKEECRLKFESDEKQHQKLVFEENE